MERIAKTLTLTILLAVLECALLSVFLSFAATTLPPTKEGDFDFMTHSILCFSVFLTLKT